jgi:hypothetical protein
VVVHECTSKEILSTETVRKLSRQASAYICAYYSLYESKRKGDDDTPTLTLPLIERLVRHSKRIAPKKIDAGFVNGFVHELQGVSANS